MPSDYSKTPLVKKLGIKPGFKLLIHDQPEHYFLLFESLPDDLELLELPVNDESVDFIHVFFTTRKALELVFDHYKKALKKNGSLWISWPKGTSKIQTDLKSDFIRNFGLEKGLVDCKVAAVDSDWSALKFMYRIKDR